MLYKNKIITQIKINQQKTIYEPNKSGLQGIEVLLKHILYHFMLKYTYSLLTYLYEHCSNSINSFRHVTLRHRPVNFPSFSNHKYLDHLSKEQIYENKLQVLDSCGSYTARAVVYNINY